MLTTHQYIATRGEYEIYQRKPGFEFTPIILGKIASFIVIGANSNVTVFAFMYSLLSALESDPVREEALLAQAVSIIQEHIDAGNIASHRDVTFEYRSGSYVGVDSPRWWIPSWD